jgi:hypothetical protein
MNTAEIQDRIRRNEQQLAKAKYELAILQAGGTVENLTMAGAVSNVEGISACLVHLRSLQPDTYAMITREGCEVVALKRGDPDEVRDWYRAATATTAYHRLVMISPESTCQIGDTVRGPDRFGDWRTEEN